MSENLVVIATFTSGPEAEVAKERLVSLGIAAKIQHDNAGGMYPNLDVTGGIMLVVNPEDESKARETLADLQTPDNSPPWRCPACGEEVAGNFSVCWNCNQERG